MLLQIGEFKERVRSDMRALVRDLQHLTDPLCEVGRPYAVRGFDFDYVGLLWFSDLSWRENRWRVDAGHVFETGIQRTRNQALNENDTEGPAHRQLLREVIQGYRILLTRPMKGIYLWFEDAGTREFGEQSLDVIR